MTLLRVSNGPQRIVCLTEEPTEILYLLGEGERVVGISAYTLRPPEAKRDKPVVSAFIDGSVSKIQALKPDLVVGFSDIQAELARKLVAANLQVLIFNQRSIQEILDVIVALGSLVHRRHEAEELVAGYIRRIDAARERTAKRAHRPKVYFEEWDEPMLCGIQWVSQLIEIAGGTDVFSERARGPNAKDRMLTMEDLIERAPDVMLASWCGKPLDLESVLARAGADEVPAIANRRIHELPPEIILQPGPACLSDGLDRLEELLHGDPRTT
jgi:iron complex transport system substrate-binding protein